MEILKKILVSFFVFCLMLLKSGTLSAQDYKALQDAFVSSYAFEKNSNFIKAIDVLKGVYDVQSYEINVRLGWLYYNAKNYSESVSYYTKAIQLKPYSIEARFGYALPASALGNWNQVLNKYIEILKIDENNYTANYRIGLIYYNRKDYAAAFKNFEKLANMYPFDYDVTHMYAWTNYRLGKLREAKILFNKALLIKPGDASALEGLGLIK
jgi:tetratricopeptide (TPR) repeat protein